VTIETASSNMAPNNRPNNRFVRTKLPLTKILEDSPSSIWTNTTSETDSPFGSNSSIEPFQEFSSSSSERATCDDVSYGNLIIGNGQRRRQPRPNFDEAKPKRDLVKFELCRANTEKISNLSPGPVDVDEISLSSEESQTPSRRRLQLEGNGSDVQETKISTKPGKKLLKKAVVMLKQARSREEEDDKTVESVEAICLENRYQMKSNSLTLDNLSKYDTLMQQSQSQASEGTSMIPLNGDEYITFEIHRYQYTQGTQHVQPARRRASQENPRPETGPSRHQKTSKTNILLDKWRQEQTILLQHAHSWDLGTSKQRHKHQANKYVDSCSPNLFIPRINESNDSKKHANNHRRYSADEANFGRPHKAKAQKNYKPYQETNYIDSSFEKFDLTNLSMTPLESTSMKEMKASRPRRSPLRKPKKNQRAHCRKERGISSSELSHESILIESDTGTEIIPVQIIRMCEC